MRPIEERRRAAFVSFSGIDGAGKSTQIAALCMRMKEEGLRVLVVTFWDDVATLRKLREQSGKHLFKGDTGVGSPSRPIVRRDKNVKSWIMTWIRLILYFLDAVSVRTAVRRALQSEADLVIFDRYTYDELVNLTLGNRAIKIYARLVLSLVPKPDISYLLDADPISAFARKPEYPLGFLYTNRQSYLDLSSLVGGMTVIPAMPVKDVEQAILGHTRQQLVLKAPMAGNEWAQDRNAGPVKS